jgi:hypothetical protein
MLSVKMIAFAKTTLTGSMILPPANRFALMFQGSAPVFEEWSMFVNVAKNRLLDA